MILSIFSWAYWHLYIFFEEIFIHILCPYLKIELFALLLLSYTAVYTLVARPLSDIYFTNIFSHSVSYLFNFSDNMLWYANIFNFDEVKCIFCCSCFWHYIHCQIKCHKDVPLWFIYMIFVLIFNELMHFEFIFMYVMRWGSNLILLQVDSQFSQYHLLKRPFSLLNGLVTLVENQLAVHVWVCFWILNFSLYVYRYVTATFFLS